MIQKPLLVVFGGIDGSGKSTHARRLNVRLNAKGIQTLLTHQPHYGFSELVESNLRGEIDPTAQLFLFAADRAQHVQRWILPALKDGLVVICDRWTACTKAYQGSGHGVYQRDIDTVNEIATQGLKPNISFFMDVPVAVAMKRLATRKELSRTEQLGEAFFDRVRLGYESNPDFNWVINTTDDYQKNADFIFDKVCKLLR